MTTNEKLTPAQLRAARRAEKLAQADREFTALAAATAAIAVYREADAAASPDAVALDAAADTAIDTLAAVLGEPDLSDSRRESLRMAIVLGADREILRAIVHALRLRRGSVITLPRGKYANLSRGRGWCRQSDGTFADRTDHEVGPGKWTVGSTDGFSRSSRETWDVSHIQVGDQTWTIAS